jgi:arsenite-transporting ATPase
VIVQSVPSFPNAPLVGEVIAQVTTGMAASFSTSLAEANAANAVPGWTIEVKAFDDSSDPEKGKAAAAAAIADAKVKYERALAALRDQSLTRFAFVLHPEATAIAETRRAGAELARLGIVTTELIVNGILPAEEASTPFFASRIAMQERYLAEIARQLPMPTRRVPLLDGEVRGVARLRALVPLLADEHAARPAFGHAGSRPARRAVDSEAAVKAALLPATGPRTIFFAGKGGVGKTVASCATAVWAARAGHRTLLVTTDPAAHIGQVLDAAVGTQPAPVDGVEGLLHRIRGREALGGLLRTWFGHGANVPNKLHPNYPSCGSGFIILRKSSQRIGGMS